MNKEMNKLLLQMVKYDLGSGILVSLIVILISTFVNAGIYMLGICVALTNFLVYGYIIAKYLGKYKKQWIIVVTYFLRMAFIAITILPFVKNILHVIYYMIGFISHYILLIVFGIKNRKGSV